MAKEVLNQISKMENPKYEARNKSKNQNEMAKGERQRAKGKRQIA